MMREVEKSRHFYFIPLMEKRVHSLLWTTNNRNGSIGHGSFETKQPVDSQPSPGVKHPLAHWPWCVFHLDLMRGGNRETRWFICWSKPAGKLAFICFVLTIHSSNTEACLSRPQRQRKVWSVLPQWCLGFSLGPLHVYTSRWETCLLAHMAAGWKKYIWELWRAQKPPFSDNRNDVPH